MRLEREVALGHMPLICFEKNKISAPWYTVDTSKAPMRGKKS